MKKDDSNRSGIDYAKNAHRQHNWKAYEGMRTILLQTQFLNEYLQRSIDTQDKNIRRHCQDRLLQLDALYDKCLEL
jgi:hypothetical protein